MSSVAPPGWYPDPSPSTPGTPPGRRWWDGTQWTAHVQPAYGAIHGAPHGAPVLPARPVGPTTPDGEPLAGWWWRVLAALVDGVVIGMVAGLVSLPAQLAVQRELAVRQRQLQAQVDRGLTPDLGDFFRDTLGIYADHVVGLMLVPFLIGIAYAAGFLRWRGATPGKLACGLRVRLRERPGRLPWGTIAARLAAWHVLPSLVLVLAFASGSLGLVVLAQLVVAAYYLTDVLWAAGSARRQALHDLVARTNVVRTR